MKLGITWTCFRRLLDFLSTGSKK